MKIALSFLLVLKLTFLFGQLEGIWYSSYRMNIQHRTETYDLIDGEFVAKKLDHIKIDTFYFPTQLVLNLQPENRLKFKGIGGKEGIGTYALQNNRILAQIDTLQLELITYKGNLLLTDIDSGWQFNHVVFERQKPLPSKELLVPDFTKKTYWIMESGQSSLFGELELVLLDSGEVIINHKQGYDNYTSWGEYKFDDYENSLYFYLIDRNSLEDRTYRLFDWESNSFSGQCYEFSLGDSLPINHHF